MTEMKGHCLCGACELTAQPGAEAGICHCSMCRKWSGGMFIAVECDAPVTFGVDNPVAVYRSSEWGERVFCGTCGSSLLWRSLDGAHQAISVQVFDDPSVFPVTSEILIDCKPHSYSLAGERKTMTEAQFMAQYAPKQEG